MVIAGIQKLIPALIFWAAGAVSQETLGVDQIRKSYFDSYELESKERYAESIRALDPVRKVYGNTYTVNYRTGWLHFKNKSWADALKHYEKALAVSPSSLEVHNAIASVHAAKQDWKAVIEQCKRVLKIDYNNVVANQWMVVAEQALGNRAVARKTAYRMLALYPTSTYFLAELGKIQYADSELAEAKETFSSVQILDPYNQTAAHYLDLFKDPKHKTPAK